MKKVLEYLDLKTILIIGLIIVILFMRMCDGSGEDDVNVVNVDGKKYELVKHTVDTILVPVKQTVYKEGKTIYKEVPIYIQLPPNTKIDTQLILREYYSKIVYKDTLKLKDSLGYIAITDTIFKNAILNRVFDANVNKITIKDITIVKELPTNEVYIGGMAGFDKGNIVNFVGPSIVLKTKKDKMYSLAVGYGTDKNVSIQAGAHWKVSLKKKKKKSKK